MEIKNLGQTDFETLFSCFEKAFFDYEISFGKEEVRSMLKRRGYDPALSFAAFDNGAMVAFTMTGTGKYGGLPTAYDIGTGTVPEYRGQDIAGRIFRYSVPILRSAGIRQYLLEVLHGNRKAISVYRRMNFQVTRQFDCFRQEADRIVGSGGNDGCRIMPVAPDAVRQAQGWCDFNPSWQNSMDSIERGGRDLIALGAFLNGRMAGYCVFDPGTGDLTQIAVSGECRRKGIATRLLHEASGRMTTGSIKVLNVDSGCTGMRAFLESRGIPLASTQFEMALPIL